MQGVEMVGPVTGIRGKPKRNADYQKPNSIADSYNLRIKAESKDVAKLSIEAMRIINN